MTKECNRCGESYSAVEDGRGEDMDNGLCANCDQVMIDQETSDD